VTDVRGAHRPTRWLPATIAAAAVLGLVALAVVVFDRSQAPRTAPASTSPVARRIAAAVVGPVWRLTRLGDEFGTMTVPRARNPQDTATLTFTPNGELEGNDGVNGIGARYRVTGHGYVVRGPVMVGAVGGAGVRADSPGARIQAAIDACSTDPGARVTLAIHADTMTVRVGGRTLVLVRSYPKPRH
jgi:hypothetical protein